MRYAAVLPFVCEAVYGYANEGHSVDVLVSESCNPSFDISGQNIKVVTFPDKPLLRLRFYSIFRSVYVCLKKQKYDLIIGLSQLGLIAASIMYYLYHVPYIYFNDEIYFGNERNSYIGNAYGKILKYFERISNRCALLSITQDAGRGRLLAEVNKIDQNSIRYLPNSHFGSAENYKSFYLHDKIGLPHSEKIILWLGSIPQSLDALALAQSTTVWPPNYSLVFHVIYSEQNSYMRKILQCHGKGRTYVSRELVSYANTKMLLASAHIGLGIYEDVGPNVRWMGHASGKINLFLMCGIPCIVSKYEGLLWVEENGAGICVESPRDVFQAIEKIDQNYNYYQNNAINTFNRILRFDDAFNVLLKEVSNLYEIKPE